MALALNNPQSLICHQDKETRSNLNKYLSSNIMEPEYHTKSVNCWDPIGNSVLSILSFEVPQVPSIKHGPYLLLFVGTGAAWWKTPWSWANLFLRHPIHFCSRKMFSVPEDCLLTLTAPTHFDYKVQIRCLASGNVDGWIIFITAFLFVGGSWL